MYLSLPPSLPPSHWWVAFWSTSGRMQLQVCTCVLIVWEALKSRKVCVSFWWKTTTFGANLEPKLLWEKSGKNMMNRVLMVLYITYDIYVYIYNLHIWHNHMHIDGCGSKNHSKNQWLEFTKGDISPSEWWLSRDPIDELPSAFDGTLGVKTSSANKRAVKSVDRSHGCFQ